MFKALINAVAGLVLCAVMLPASATITSNFGQYSVSYDEATSFGGIGFNSSGGGGSVAFGWNIPATAAVISTGGLAFTQLDLPEFTVTPNPGYSLSGNIGAFMGNLVYVEVAGGTTLANVSGLLALNGGAANVLNTDLDKTISNPFSGYYSATGSLPFGTFSSLTFSGGLLRLAANAVAVGDFAAITAQPQNIFSISFTAAVVPEPENYLLLLAGLGLIGAIVRRRSLLGG